MKATSTEVRLAIACLALAACGGDSGRPVVIPDVPAGAYETDCQRLCTRAADESICKPKHAEFCLARCRAVTRGLSTACTDCLIKAGKQIAGDVNTVTNDRYCLVGGPADIGSCTAACDDGGAAGPAPDLDTLCRLECSFHMQDPDPLACSADGSKDCLAACSATIAARGRVCARCLIEQTIPVRTCLGGDCDCSPVFKADTNDGCRTLCDALPPAR
jgi:hypothetical protein